jgi:hypothetical protein
LITPSADIEPFENALSHGTAANLPSIVVNSIIYGSRENMRPPVRPLASDKNESAFVLYDINVAIF